VARGGSRTGTVRGPGRRWGVRLTVALLALTTTGDYRWAPPADVDPAWPPPAPVDLPTELAASAAQRAARRILARQSVPPPEREPSALSVDAPGIQARQGDVEGLVYLEVVLGEIDPETPLPMVVLIHGRGDRPRVPGGPFYGIRYPMRIVMPRAKDALGTGFSWLPVRARDGQDDVLAYWLEEMALRIAHLVEVLRTTRPTLGKPIVSGFSQGGMLTFTLAVEHPETFSVALPLAGWLPPLLWPDGLDPLTTYPPILTMHGTDDEAVRLGPTIQAVDQLRDLGMYVALETFEGVGHRMIGPMNDLFRDWLAAAIEAQAPPVLSVSTPGATAAPDPVVPPGASPALDGGPGGLRERETGSPEGGTPGFSYPP